MTRRSGDGLEGLADRTLRRGEREQNCRCRADTLDAAQMEFGSICFGQGSGYRQTEACTILGLVHAARDAAEGTLDPIDIFQCDADIFYLKDDLSIAGYD